MKCPYSICLLKVVPQRHCKIPLSVSSSGKFKVIQIMLSGCGSFMLLLLKFGLFKAAY